MPRRSVVGDLCEARPNVTVDVAPLRPKTGNAVIQRGGKETQYQCGDGPCYSAGAQRVRSAAGGYPCD